MKNIVGTVVFALNLLLLSCQSPQPNKPTWSLVEPPTVTAKPDAEILQTAALNPEQVGYIVIDAESGRAVRSFQSNKPFTPASVAKIATTLYALEMLGPQHRYQTRLGFLGSRKGQSWKGTLFLKGDGDPYLLYSDLMNFVAALQNQGVKEIRGNFFYDTSLFPSVDALQSNQEIDGVFNPAISPLSTEFNRLRMFWKRTEASERYELFAIPALPKIQFSVSSSTPKNPHFHLDFEKAGEEQRWMLQEPPAEPEESYEVPYRDGARFTALALRQLCQHAGLVLPDPSPGKMPARLDWTFDHRSAPLWELAGKVLEHSNNLMAELLLLTATRKTTGKPTNIEHAAQQMVRYWSQRLGRGHWENAVLENGSGLSIRSQVTAEDLGDLLSFAYRKRYDHKSWFSLLPISAWTGTLRDRFQSIDGALRVWAKTGTMNYTSSLAGMFFSRSNRPYLFAVLLSDPRYSTQLSTTDDSKQWLKTARDLQEKLVTNWIASL